MNTLEKISELLKEKNKTQKELMTFLGKSPNIYTDWLSGKNKSYKKYINDIADFLEVNPLVLLLPEKYNNVDLEVNYSKNNSVNDNIKNIMQKIQLLHTDQQKQVEDFVNFLFNQNIVNANKKDE